ncbi:MAG: molybdopterin-binding protein [Chloroflexota bacterium]|nr:molybdopterin-binding protein [Chloroflexota bacterium]
MRLERIVPGRASPPGLAGAVLTRDLVVDGRRWAKGRALGVDDLAALGSAGVRVEGGPRSLAAGIAVLILEPTDLHEDEAARRLAAAAAGPGVVLRGPAESRIDLLAAHDGVVHVQAALVERLDRIDPVEVFTVFDGQVVRAGELVASVKVAPHVVPGATIERAERIAARSGSRGLVSVAGFVRRRVGVVVKESLHAPARERFEASVRLKVESLGSTLGPVTYVEDDADAVTEALAAVARGRGPARADLVLTAGSASTDPSDPFFVAIDRLGGRIVRHGVPAHPGSMLWLARIGRTDVLGLPTCGAYSKATAADLLLPRLLSGERASAATVARLGVGGILTRSMRFRFPAYARELEAPDG